MSIVISDEVIIRYRGYSETLLVQGIINAERYAERLK